MDETIEIEPTGEPTVYVRGDVETRYGPKLALGGDTYELLSGDGEGLADELDFSETHCAFDWDSETWTIDHGGLRLLREVLEDHGYRLGGVGAELLDVLNEVKDPGADSHYWSGQGIRVRVEYENTNGNPGSKEGLVTAADRDRGFVQFEPEDRGGRLYQVEGNAILAPRSDYPFMGKVERVTVEP